ncbi:MAG: hypothetical protein HDKAJFGB_04179 [Anaerolineae bacterium]|nr:hypothetical protein [Anaerolineae bacterium]
MNDDLGGFVRVFHLEQTLDHFIFFRARLAGIHLNDLVRVTSLKKVFGLNQFYKLSRVRGVACNDEQERFDDGLGIFARIRFEFDFDAFVQAHAVFQFDLFQLFGRQSGGREIFARDDGRFFDKAVRHCLAERIIHNHIFEWQRAFARLDKRRRREFQPQNRFQFVNGAHARRRAIAMRFVHQHHKVVESRKIIKITLPNIFRQTLDARRFAAAHFGIDFRDIENVDFAAQQRIKQTARRHFVIVAVDERGRIHRKFRDAFEHIFRRVGRKVGDEFVVDGEIRREDKKIIDAVREMQIGNERAHQARLAHTRRQRKTDRWKIAFKIGDGWKFRADFFQHLQTRRVSKHLQTRHVSKHLQTRHVFWRRVSFERWINNFHHAVQHAEGFVLRRTERETSCNRVNVAIHFQLPKRDRFPKNLSRLGAIIVRQM